MVNDARSRIPGLERQAKQYDYDAQYLLACMGCKRRRLIMNIIERFRDKVLEDNTDSFEFIDTKLKYGGIDYGIFQ